MKKTLIILFTALLIFTAVSCDDNPEELASVVFNNQTLTVKTVYCSNVETHGTGISVYFCTKEGDASFIPSDGINIDIPVEDFGKTLTYPEDNFDGAGWSFYVEGVGIYSDVKIDYDYNFTNGSLTTSEIETGKPISISFSGTNTNGDTVTIEYQGTPIWIDRYPTGMISDDD